MSKPKRTRPKRNTKQRPSSPMMADVRSIECLDDTQIARQRLEELRQSPDKVVRGPALAKKMKRWMS